MKKVLIAITSHSDLGNTGEKTGWYLPEVSHFYFEVARHGVEADFVSPNGGKAPMDENSRNLSDPENLKFVQDQALMSKVENTLSPSQVDPTQYSAIFFAGGHGTMWDFPKSQALAKVTSRI